jgi:glycosyltransferase
MKISIITVTKNNKTGLLRAIECVRSQTYQNVEHIIVDGGSTDGTMEILRQFDKLSAGLAQDDIEPLTTHSSLITVSEADSGIYDAINKGIKMATGDVIGLLHSDDLYADENVIAKYAEVFERSFNLTQDDNKRIDAVYSDLVYVKEVKSKQRTAKGEKTNYSSQISDHSIIRYWKAHNQKMVNGKQNPRQTQDDSSSYSPITDHLLRFGWMPPHPTLFIRKKVFDKYGLYNTDLKIAADFEMILRLFYKNKIATSYLPLTTYFMQIGGTSNKSISNIFQKSKEDYIAMKLNGISLPFITLVSKNLRKLPQFFAR